MVNGKFDLPIDGNYLITMDLGSGKTSIAIHRTDLIKQDNPSSSVKTFLFTNTLNDFFNDGISTLRLRLMCKFGLNGKEAS